MAFISPEARYNQDGQRMGEYDKAASKYYSGEVLEANDTGRFWGYMMAPFTLGMSAVFAELDANDRRMFGKVDPW